MSEAGNMEGDGDDAERASSGEDVEDPDGTRGPTLIDPDGARRRPLPGAAAGLTPILRSAGSPPSLL
jgi:hypothetical protein